MALLWIRLAAAATKLKLVSGAVKVAGKILKSNAGLLAIATALNHFGL